MRNEGLGMAVGSRSHLENEALAKRSWYRNFLMRGFHLLVLSVAGGAIRDTQCGFKVSFPAICLLHFDHPLVSSVAGGPIGDTQCGFQVSFWTICLLLFDHFLVFSTAGSASRDTQSDFKSELSHQPVTHNDACTWHPD